MNYSDKLKKWIKTCLICIIPYLILVLITICILPDVYMFKWTLKEGYYFTWVVVIVAAFFSPYRTYYMSFSLPVITALAQMIGDIENKRITESYTQMGLKYSYTGYFVLWNLFLLGTIVVFEFVYAIKKKYIDLKTDDFGRTTIRWSLFSSGILFSCALIVLFLPIEHEKLGLEIPEYASIFVMITCVTVTLYKLRVGLTITASYWATITLFRIIGWILNGLVPGQLNISPKQNLIWTLMKIVFFAVCIPGFYILIKKMINSRIKSKNEEVHTSI